MLFYISILIVLLLLSFYKCSYKIFVAIVLVLSFFLGFRGETVGADTQRYVEYYNYMEYGLGYMEIGWNILSVTIKHLGFSPYAFHFLIAVLTLSMIAFVLTRFHDKQINMLGLYFTYSLGFYLLMFNGMRQLFAGAIVLVGFYFLSVNRNRIFLLTVFFATLFHGSTIFALAAYLLRWFKLSQLGVAISLMVTLLIGLLASNEFFVYVAGKYAHDIDTYGYRDSLAYAIIVGGLSNIFFYYLYVVSGSKIQDSFWMKLYFLSILVMNATINIVIGPRIVYIFSISQVVAFSLLAKHISRQETKILLYLFGIITFFRFILPEAAKVEESLIPYYYTFQIYLK